MNHVAKDKANLLSAVEEITVVFSMVISEIYEINEPRHEISNNVAF